MNLSSSLYCYRKINVYSSVDLEEEFVPTGKYTKQNVKSLYLVTIIIPTQCAQNK